MAYTQDNYKHIPQDIWTVILSFLERKYLFLLSSVSKDCFAACNHDCMWKINETLDSKDKFLTLLNGFSDEYKRFILTFDEKKLQTLKTVLQINLYKREAYFNANNFVIHPILVSTLFSKDGCVCLISEAISLKNAIDAPYLLCLNGITALKEKLITIETAKKVTPLTTSCRTDLRQLFTKNGLYALRKKLLSSEEAIEISDLKSLLSDIGIKALENEIITPKQAKEFYRSSGGYRNERYANLNGLLSKNGVKALSKKLLTPEQAYKISDLQTLLSDSGLYALEKKLITPEQASKFRSDGTFTHLTSLTGILSKQGIQILSEKLLSIDEAFKIKFMSCLFGYANIPNLLRDQLISADELASFDHQANFMYTIANDMKKRQHLKTWLEKELFKNLIQQLGSLRICWDKNKKFAYWKFKNHISTSNLSKEEIFNYIELAKKNGLEMVEIVEAEANKFLCIINISNKRYESFLLQYYKNKGDVLCKAKDFKNALTPYYEIAEINPTDAAIHYKIGILHKVLQNFEQASKAFYKSIEIEPTNFNACHELANIHIDTKNTDGFKEILYLLLRKRSFYVLSKLISILEKKWLDYPLKIQLSYKPCYISLSNSILFKISDASLFCFAFVLPLFSKKLDLVDKNLFFIRQLCNGTLQDCISKLSDQGLGKNPSHFFAKYHQDKQAVNADILFREIIVGTSRELYLLRKRNVPETVLAKYLEILIEDRQTKQATTNKSKIQSNRSQVLNFKN